MSFSFIHDFFKSNLKVVKMLLLTFLAAHVKYLQLKLVNFLLHFTFFLCQFFPKTYTALAYSLCLSFLLLYLIYMDLLICIIIIFNYLFFNHTCIILKLIEFIYIRMLLLFKLKVLVFEVFVSLEKLLHHHLSNDQSFFQVFFSDMV